MAQKKSYITLDNFRAYEMNKEGKRTEREERKEVNRMMQVKRDVKY